MAAWHSGIFEAIPGEPGSGKLVGRHQADPK